MLKLPTTMNFQKYELMNSAVAVGQFILSLWS